MSVLMVERAQYAPAALASDAGISADEVVEALRRAYETCKRLPAGGRGLGPSRRMTWWPDFMPEQFGHRALERTGAPPRLRPAAPSPEDIDRMDRAFAWMWWVDEADRAIVSARACGFSWRAIEDIDGRSERTLRKVHGSAIAGIVMRLQGGAPAEQPGAQLGELVAASPVRQAAETPLVKTGTIANEPVPAPAGAPERMRLVERRVAGARRVRALYLHLDRTREAEGVDVARWEDDGGAVRRSIGVRRRVYARLALDRWADDGGAA